MKYIILCCMVCFKIHTHAQELFPLTEPASNMPANSVGIRINQTLMPSFQESNLEASNTGAKYRLNPELMWGISKKLMVHANVYASNMYQQSFRFEGASMYFKYRFFSKDDTRQHFRLACFGKASKVNNPFKYNEINLGGDNSGIGLGVIATQLLHKLALSFTGGYTKAFRSNRQEFSTAQPTETFSYSLSSGYLLWPLKYKSFNQPNFNIYFEVLGNFNPENEESFLDLAPAFQIILKSRTRIDVGYRKQINGNMLRLSESAYFLKFEYNIFNINHKKNA